jgi:hypothetical protein
MFRNRPIICGQPGWIGEQGGVMFAIIFYDISH